MSKKIVTSTICLLLTGFFLSSCHDDKKNTSPSTAFDTGRLFIESCLKGDFSTAEALLYNDADNKNYFDIYKKKYETLTSSEKQAYQKTDYIIQEIKEPNDSVCLIRYQNNYKKQPTNIKIIKDENRWKIDFKYTFIYKDSMK